MTKESQNIKILEFLLQLKPCGNYQLWKNKTGICWIDKKYIKKVEEILSNKEEIENKSNDEIRKILNPYRC